MSFPLSEQVTALIKRSKKILCLTQSSPDGDQISSMLAMQVLLGRLKKEVHCIIPDGVKREYQFLLGSEKIQKDLGEEGDFVVSISTALASVDHVRYTIEDDSVDILVTPKKGQFSPEDVSFRQSAGNFDLIITLGSPSLEDLGIIFEQHTALFSRTPIINIDTNPENQYYGRVNAISIQESSVSEMVFLLADSDAELTGYLDEELATILLSGIISRTHSFLGNYTTAASLDSASKLFQLGAKQSDIIENLFKKKSLTTLKIWGRVLSSLQVDRRLKITWSRLTSADLEILEATQDQLSDLNNSLLRFVEGSDLSVLFVENNDTTTIQISRANPGINLREIQKITGGEILPEGLQIENQGSLSEAETQLLALITDYQKSRLQIVDSIPLKPMKIEHHEVEEASEMFTIKSQQSVKKISAKAPEAVPFEAPLQPHETTGIVGDSSAKTVGKKPGSEPVEIQPSNREDHNKMKGVQEVEISLPQHQKGIPDWLRKQG